MRANSPNQTPRRRPHLFADVYQVSKSGQWLGEVYNREGVTVFLSPEFATRAEAMTAANDWITNKLAEGSGPAAPAPVPGVRANVRR
jgi:hypothetical protein